jgi:hypothetical protein
VVRVVRVDVVQGDRPRIGIDAWWMFSRASERPRRARSFLVRRGPAAFSQRTLITLEAREKDK